MTTREEKLETALQCIIFELRTLPPMPGSYDEQGKDSIGFENGIPCSSALVLKIAREALKV